MIIVPDYYREFHCIADKCRHSCCIGWEIDIDDESAERFLKNPKIAPHIEMSETPHFILEKDERCPFLRRDGLCKMILENGEKSLCQICRDHPRFRNFFSGRTEIGLGLVCEEAAKIILLRKTPMKLEILEDDGKNEPLGEDEKYILQLREKLISEISQVGHKARLLEYLYYRYLPDALYDGLLEKRILFIKNAFHEVADLWDKSDGSADAIVELARNWSYNVEYDDEVIVKRITE